MPCVNSDICKPKQAPSLSPTSHNSSAKVKAKATPPLTAHNHQTTHPIPRYISQSPALTSSQYRKPCPPHPVLVHYPHNFPPDDTTYSVPHADYTPILRIHRRRGAATSVTTTEMRAGRDLPNQEVYPRSRKDQGGGLVAAYGPSRPGGVWLVVWR
jgi:hypothetical protein